MESLLQKIFDTCLQVSKQGQYWIDAGQKWQYCTAAVMCSPTDGEKQEVKAFEGKEINENLKANPTLCYPENMVSEICDFPSGLEKFILGQGFLVDSEKKKAVKREGLGQFTEIRHYGLRSQIFEYLKNHKGVLGIVKKSHMPILKLSEEGEVLYVLPTMANNLERLSFWTDGKVYRVFGWQNKSKSYKKFEEVLNVADLSTLTDMSKAKAISDALKMPVEELVRLGILPPEELNKETAATSVPGNVQQEAAEPRVEEGTESGESGKTKKEDLKSVPEGGVGLSSEEAKKYFMQHGELQVDGKLVRDASSDSAEHRELTAEEQKDKLMTAFVKKDPPVNPHIATGSVITQEEGKTVAKSVLSKESRAETATKIYASKEKRKESEAPEEKSADGAHKRRKTPKAKITLNLEEVCSQVGAAIPDEMTAEEAVEEIRQLRDLMLVAARRSANLAIKQLERTSASTELVNQLKGLLQCS